MLKDGEIMASAKNNTTSTENRNSCTCCPEDRPKEFYKSFNQVHKNTQKLPICKQCIEIEYQRYMSTYNDSKLALYYICRKFDIFFCLTAYEGALNQSASTGWTIIQSYMKQINSFRDKNDYSHRNGYGVCFDDSFEFLDRVVINNDNNKVDKYDNNDEIIKVKKGKAADIKNVSPTKEDEKAQADILRLLGYDPFLEYEMSDKIFLCNDLVTYLDEDTVDDAYKCSVVLQIVNNNNQIRKIDIAINQLSSDIDSIVKNSKDIDGLASIKQKLNQANDKLSKENNIALKHRDGNGTQNSTLGSMMKKLRELGFEKAEHDYYDMCQSFGIRKSADISNQSILDILHFDDNDVNNMFKMQREELQKLQDKELGYKEQIRILIKENNELKK